MSGATLDAGGEARGTGLRRQHGRLRPRLRHGGRGRARHRAPAARGLAARADGRARARRQSPRRLRRHLQRRLLRAAARPLRHPAREDAARRRRRLRPPADDRPHRARRRRGRPRRRRPRRACARWSAKSGRRLPELVDLYDNTASLQDRTVSTGMPRPELARQYRCRRLSSAAPRAAASTPAAPPLRPLRPRSPSTCRCCTAGDVNARVWIRIREIEQSLALIDALLRSASRRPAAASRCRRREPRRKAWRWSKASAATSWPGCGIRPDDTIARCHLRDPSWFQWPLLEAVIEGNIVADFPLCNKSFNCSYSGHDL